MHSWEALQTFLLMMPQLSLNTVRKEDKLQNALAAATEAKKAAEIIKIDKPHSFSSILTMWKLLFTQVHNSFDHKYISVKI